MQEIIDKNRYSDIPIGESNAISKPNLSKVWKTDPRNVSRIVLALNIQGYIIASSDHGYYVPTNEEELTDYYLRFHKSAMSTLTRLKAVRSEIKRRGINPNELIKSHRKKGHSQDESEKKQI